MNPDAERGTDLERRGETLPEVSVAHRAGSIVTEFVSSIVEEAQARGTQIIAEAEEEVRSQREDAAMGAARVRDRLDALLPELSALVETIRRESAELSGEPAPETALPPRLTPAAAQEAIPVEDAEIVEAVVVEDEAQGEQVPAEVAAAGQNGSGDLDAPGDPRARVSQMSDEELARTYTNTLAALRRTDDGDYAAELSSLAEAAVEEALSRPAFEETEPEPRRGLRRRAAARRWRRKAEILSDLRAACRHARERQVATTSPGG